MDMRDPRFGAVVERLRVPQMGTEVVAPLLAQLVGFLRPERVLEIGMGYTTPFLASALDSVRRRTIHESGALAAKSRPYLADGAELDEPWLDAEPALLDPGFFLRPYQPHLVAVDNLSIAGSSADRVLDVLTELGLADLVTVVNADLRDCVDLLPEGFEPIDLAWVDAWECLFFFDHFWDLIDPAGGVVLMHYLMTYPEGEAILAYLRQFQRANPGELEIVSLLEPHKLVQNSLTMLRRTSAVPRRAFAGPGGQVRYDERLRADAEALAAAVADGVTGRAHTDHTAEPTATRNRW
jgi:predicted O-methyltransferase YrrM